MTDYKQLCAELVSALDTVDTALLGTDRAKGAKVVRDALQCARAALAEPEPEGPTDEALDELFTEIDQSGEPESWRVYARAVLVRWGQ